MKMAELEARTGVHRETIRVYFRLGLLPDPERPHRNAAVYDEQHVEAIGVVQRLQRENRLSLPEIGAMLKGVAPRLDVEAHTFSQIERLVAARVGYDQRLVPIGSLIEQSEKAPGDADELERLGIVRIVKEASGDSLSLADSQLVLIWGQMRAAGFSADLGFGPAMLGFYLQAAEFVAGWEAKTFLERTRDRIQVDDAVLMLEQALPLMLKFFGVLRMRAFIRNIDSGVMPRSLKIKDPSL